jgi:hypothetical protein
MSFHLLCCAGILVRGRAQDFLSCVCAAEEAKAIWSKQLPQSSLRLHFYYPNRKRVSASDIRAAIVALADPKIADMIGRRRVAATEKTPARSEARTADFCAASGHGVGEVNANFSQAGVVAPPDGLTDETLAILTTSRCSG